MAKNCTCSQLQETIDKIFIDDSCCCQSTVVTPTDNCCSCEPVIDLIDTDKFACASFDNNRNLKYQMVKESWLVYGTNSKTVYNAIIEAQAANIMLLLKVLGGNINENTKNYVVSPIEITQDVESELYIIKYFKFIEDKLHICIYTIHKVDDNNYETSWDSELLDAFDADQYYTKTESDGKYVTKQYLENNYYNSSSIDTIISNFYNKTEVYNKSEIDAQILWEIGNTDYPTSTKRKNAECSARGDGAFVTGYNNTVNGIGSAVVGTNNNTTGMCNFTTGSQNIVEGQYNIVSGNSNNVISNNTFVVGDINKASIDGNSKPTNIGIIGNNNTVAGNYSFAGGQGNKVSANHSFSYGLNNKITGNKSATFGFDNNVSGYSAFAAGANNKIEGQYSSALGFENTIGSSGSTALGDNNDITKDNSFAIGNNNYVTKEFSIAMNESSRSAGMSSIAGGRRSYTGGIGACAIGSPINIQYYARLIREGDPRYSDYSSDGHVYLVITDEEGNPINITENSIQDKRFRFTAEMKKKEESESAIEGMRSNPEDIEMESTDAEQAQNEYLGELTIELTSREKDLADTPNTNYAIGFSLKSIWPSIVKVVVIEDGGNRYIYFEPYPTTFKDINGNEHNSVKWLFDNSLKSQEDPSGQGVRKIYYASGYDGCKAVGYGSHTEGVGTIAKGEGSHSEGINTVAINAGEHACGRYNYSGNGTLFSVGVGKEQNVNTSDNTDAGGAKVEIIRKNALEITSDGNIYLRVKNDNDTETVYDLSKLLNALITSTGINTSGLTDIRQNSQDAENSDILPATTKEM